MLAHIYDITFICIRLLYLSRSALICADESMIYSHTKYQMHRTDIIRSQDDRRGYLLAIFVI